MHPLGDQYRSLICIEWEALKKMRSPPNGPAPPSHPQRLISVSICGASTANRCSRRWARKMPFDPKSSSVSFGGTQGSHPEPLRLGSWAANTWGKWNRLVPYGNMGRVNLTVADNKVISWQPGRHSFEQREGPGPECRMKFCPETFWGMWLDWVSGEKGPPCKCHSLHSSWQKGNV